MTRSPLAPQTGARLYLNTASTGLPCDATAEAMRTAASDWQSGNNTLADWDTYINQARSAFAELVGVDTAEIAVGSHLSSTAGMVAASLKPGSRVLIASEDFTSVNGPFLQHRERGVQVQSVPLEALIDSITPGIDWVAVSSVQSSDGRMIDVGELTEIAHAGGARVFVDATQAAGWLPINATNIDVLACSAYKWLGCPRGTSFTRVAPHLWDELTAINAGWYAAEKIHESYYGDRLELASTARRFDLSPAWMLFQGAVPALRHILKLGVQNIWQHDLHLANMFRQQIGQPPTGSAIVAVAASAETARALESAGVKASPRNGKVRLSFHWYNDSLDVDVAARCWTPQQVHVALEWRH